MMISMVALNLVVKTRTKDGYIKKALARVTPKQNICKSFAATMGLSDPFVRMMPASVLSSDAGSMMYPGGLDTKPPVVPNVPTSAKDHVKM